MNHNMTSKTVGILLIALVSSQGMAFAGPAAPTEMVEVVENEELVHGHEIHADLRKIAWATCFENYFDLLGFLGESLWVVQGYAMVEKQKEEDLDYCKQHFDEEDERSACEATALADYEKRFKNLRPFLVHLSIRGVHLALSTASCLGIL